MHHVSRCYAVMWRSSSSSSGGGGSSSSSCWRSVTAAGRRCVRRRQAVIALSLLAALAVQLATQTRLHDAQATHPAGTNLISRADAVHAGLRQDGEALRHADAQLR